MRTETGFNPFLYRNGENPSLLRVSPIRLRGDSVDENMPTDYDVEIYYPTQD